MGYGVPYIQKETFRRSNNLDIKGIWTHGNSIVLAWLPIPSFDDILKNNNKNESDIYQAAVGLFDSPWY